MAEWSMEVVLKTEPPIFRIREIPPKLGTAGQIERSDSNASCQTLLVLFCPDRYTANYTRRRPSRPTSMHYEFRLSLGPRDFTDTVSTAPLHKGRLR